MPKQKKDYNYEIKEKKKQQPPNRCKMGNRKQNIKTTKNETKFKVLNKA